MIEITLTLTGEEIEATCKRVEAQAMLYLPRPESTDVRDLVAVVRAALANGFAVSPITVQRDGP